MRVGIDMSFSSLRGLAQRNRDLKSAPPALASPGPPRGCEETWGGPAFPHQCNSGDYLDIAKDVQHLTFMMPTLHPAS